MIRALFTIFLILTLVDSFGQDLKPSSSDLNGAQQTLLNKPYSFPISPKGYGNAQEFRIDNKRSEYYFKEERNTIWFVIDVPFNGVISFEITPHSKTDDYDWMLFSNTPDLKDLIKKGNAKLLRSNNSRNDKTINGKTGIKEGFNNLYESPGPGKNYSKALQVKTGQKLALIIDNIYELGGGFDFSSELKPQILSKRTLTGIVTSKATLLPLLGSIICEDDSTGVKLGETGTGLDGKYTLQIPANRPVNITAKSSGYLFQTFDIKPDLNNEIQDFTLSPIDESNKLLLYNIHFTPDKDLIKPNSEPELDRLIDLLNQQKNWEVRIVGHTNNNPFADAKYLQKLSFNRAIAVKQYLIQSGVSEKRISCAGMGGKNPVILTRNAEEGLKNLRVEVVISKK